MLTTWRRVGRAAAIAADLLAAVDRPVAVAVAVDGDEHDRFDLGEPVDHGPHAELGGAARPHRAERRRGEERHERLGDVRGVGDDAVAGGDPQPAQALGGGTDLRGQLGPRQLDRVAGLAAGDDGDVAGRRGRRGERVLGVVERAAGEPRDVGHRRTGAHRGRFLVPPHPGELGDPPPEVLGLDDRPGVQRGVVGEPLRRGELTGDRGAPGIVGRGPQHLAAVRGHRAHPASPAARPLGDGTDAARGRGRRRGECVPRPREQRRAHETRHERDPEREHAVGDHADQGDLERDPHRGQSEGRRRVHPTSGHERDRDGLRPGTRSRRRA